MKRALFYIIGIPVIFVAFSLALKALVVDTPTVNSFSEAAEASRRNAEESEAYFNNR